MKVFTVRLAAAILFLSSLAVAQSGGANLTGAWTFTVETSAGAGMPTITLKQDGQNLTGHYSGQLGEADLAGTVKGQDVTFKFDVDAQGMKLTCTYTGTIENKVALKGTVDIAGLAEGTFTAKRQP
jgi:hypothetical protein